MTTKDRVQRLIDEAMQDHLDDPRGEIVLEIPQRAGHDFHMKLFNLVAELINKAEPRKRDWDVSCYYVSNNVTVPVHLLTEALAEGK